MLHETNLHPASMDVNEAGGPQMAAKGGHEAQACSSNKFYLSTAASTGSSCSTWEAAEAAVASMCCLAGLASSKSGTSALQHAGQGKSDTVSAFQEHGRQLNLTAAASATVTPCAPWKSGFGCTGCWPRGKCNQDAQAAHCRRLDGMKLGHSLGHSQMGEHVVGQVAPQAEVPLCS